MISERRTSNVSGHPASPSAGRRANRQLVLETLRKEGPCSQAAIARSTGLSRATVSNIVKGLRAADLATVQPVNGREALVALVPRRGLVVSVRVGLGHIDAVAFSFADATRWDERWDVASDGESSPQAVVSLIDRLATRRGVERSEIAGVALSLHGPIARSSGAIAPWATVSLPLWADVPLQRALQDALEIPVIADNDGNLAALAEWTWGAGRGVEDLFYVNCSDGVGAGVLLNGRIYQGGDGMAGEIGHVALDQSGPVCYCGNRGCLTTYASERYILLSLENSGVRLKSLRDVISRARAGDLACQRVLFEAGRRLGWALANAAKVLAPSVIVIGGVLATAGPLVFDSLRTSGEIQGLRAVNPSIQFRTGQIHTDAAILGGVAAILADQGQGLSDLPEWTHSKPRIIQEANTSRRSAG